jgi:16S rRNA (adenine1518-N6/adenine1519-N6)-dimethyltransferase
VNLTAPSQVADLLRRHGFRPRKSLGQSFLVDQNVLDRIVDSADLSPEDGVLEIGAGLGTLSRALAARGRQVISLEIDRDLIPVLSETTGDLPNLQVVCQDALTADIDGLLETLAGGHIKVVANIPYYVTSPLLELLLERSGRLSLIVLLVQKEVAQRLVARPGTPDYGSLTVFAQYHAEAELVSVVSPKAFLPAPKVESAILRLTPRPRRSLSGEDEARFFQVVRAGFSQRRKTLYNCLRSFPPLGLSSELAAQALAQAGIEPRRRGETLSLAEFARVSQAVESRRAAG